MITPKNEEILKSVLLESSPVLFLGAGFSVGSQSKSKALVGTQLKMEILEQLIKAKVSESDYKEIADYDLRKVCDEVYNIYNGKNELYSLLTSIYKDTYPGKNRFHTKLLSYPWKSIFTVKKN